jgi:hypothetical protein
MRALPGVAVSISRLNGIRRINHAVGRERHGMKVTGAIKTRDLKTNSPRENPFAVPFILASFSGYFSLSKRKITH